MAMVGVLWACAFAAGIAWAVAAPAGRKQPGFFLLFFALGLVTAIAITGR